MQPKLLVIVFPAGVVLSGCSVTQGTTPAHVELDSAAAKTQASALTVAASSAEADDGPAIAEALAKIGDAAASFVPQAKDGARERLKPAATTCTCDAVAKSCVFDGCSIDGATVAGSLSWASGQIRCTGLSVDIAATSASIGKGHLAIECAMTYGAGHLAGRLHAAGSAVVDGVTYGWDATIDATGVAFDRQSFTGGSVDVSAAVTMSSAAERDRSFEASALVTLK